MPDPVKPSKLPNSIPDLLNTQSSVQNDTNSHHSGDDEGDEVDVRSFLAPAQGEGELGRLERYRILKELGHGGMGMVLLGEDVNLRRMAAIKVMLPKFAKAATARERFLREARAAAKINHDNVVRIHQVDEANGIPFIAMEFLKGAPLDQYLKDKGELPLGMTLRIGREIAEGLQAAHAEGLIHRDIKPANVWLEAPKGRVKILDFGLAREENDDAHITKSGAVVGTPAFMSPEQAYGKPLDPRSDLFSLGVVLYRLCTGEQPFTGPNTMAVLMALGTHNPPPVRKVNPNVPVELDRLIQRLMEKDREKRPASAEEVGDALAAIEKPTSSGVPEVMYIAPVATVVENPFADIDDSNYQNPASQAATAPASFKNKAKKASRLPSGAGVFDSNNSNTPAPDGSRLAKKPRRLLFAGLAGILAIAAAVIIIKVTNKDGTVTELKVPDGSKVEVVDKGKTIVVVDPKPTNDPIAKVEPKKVDPVDPPPFVQPTFDEKEAKKQQEDWATKLKLPVESTNKLGMKMILIPPAGEALPKAYLLGKYEVTQGEWEKVMGYNPSEFSATGSQKAKVAGLDTSKLPVDTVSWFDSVEFCNKLSEQEGLKPYYALEVTKRSTDKQIEEAEVKILSGNGYRIPTDADWTWGCVAGAKTKYHFGDKEEDLLAYAWFKDNSEGRTHGVGEKKPNAFGLFDMHGNVVEWNEEMLSNAKGAPERLLRGGYWNNIAYNCAVSPRYRNGPPAYRTNGYGLRVARSPLTEAPVTLPAFDEKEAKKQQEDWATKLKLPVESTNKLGMKMILIPPAGEAMPKPYLLGKYEVTQAEWEKVMGYNPSEFGPKNAKVKGLDTSKFPVESVGWYDSVEFCNKLSEKEGLKPYYALEVTKRGTQIDEAEVKILGGSGYHIPTDAEWEHGCRAGTKTKYYSGDKDEDLLEVAWFDKNSEGRTHAVGEKKPNAFGLYDMHGNVREWNEEMLTNATSGAPERVLRGGAWNFFAPSCAVSLRHRLGPANRSYPLGFRVARTPLSEAPVNPPPFVPPTFDEKEAKKQQEDWATKLKLPVESTNKLGMKMMLIPPAGEALPKPYLLGKYEVTQAEWEKVMGYNPSSFGPKNPKVVGLDTSKFPVEQVSWYDSVEFCNKLSELEGLKPYYELTVTKRSGTKHIDEAEVKILGGTGYHIPTDAEWEHGCRAGTNKKYHFGDKNEELLEYAWIDKNSEVRTHAVGEKKPNAFGLYDIHGNVWEWNEEMLTNAKGAPERVLRGGSWYTTDGYCPVSHRTRHDPAYRHYSVGLRLARVALSDAANVNPPPYVPVALAEKEAKQQQADWAAKLKLPVESTNKIGMKMILIPPAGEAIPKPYLLGKYEVTQGEWEKVMGYNPSGFGPMNPKVAGMDTSKFPVEHVNWYDSVEFCNKLSEKEGLKPYYDLKVTKRGGKDSNQIEEAEVTILGGNGYHIPTDAEWTLGCAAGYKTMYHFGDKDEQLLEYAWFKDNSDGRPHVVGEKKPNAFGLHDMHGNVWEWNEEILTNAKTGAPERVIRGGSWNAAAGDCAVSYRFRNRPALRNAISGLRLAQVPLSEAAVNLPTLDEKEAKKQQEDWAAKLKLPVEATNKLGMKMILIPPAGDALPKPYYLGKYEVTQGEWEKVMASNPSKFAPPNALVAGMETSKFPVENVIWFDCVEFCNKLSTREGFRPYYQLTASKGNADEIVVKILGGNGYHIPTDAEWEHGCRAGTKSKYHFGDREEDLPEYAWFDKNSDKRTHAVGEKKPNAFGLFDMHGNVWEWNEDMLTIANGTPERVIRGGSWLSPAVHCAGSNRHRHGPAYLSYYFGLRVARTP